MVMRAAPLILAIAGTALLVGGGILYLGAGDEPAPPGLEPGQAQAEGAPPVESAAFGWPAVASGDAAGDTATSDPGLEALRDEVPVDPVTAAEAPRVLVVRGTPPTPVPDAEVLFVTVPDAMRRFGKELPRRRMAWPELCGQRLVTDADGIAVLPPTRRSWLCSARTPGEFAFAVVRTGNRTTTMTLLADETVTIEVTTSDGKPAPDVPLQVLQHSGGSRGARTLWRGESAANGRAIVAHFQFMRRGLREGVPERFAAALGVATAKPIVTEFEGRPPPEEPIRLVLPPVGQIEVVLTDFRDRPLLSPAAIAIAPLKRVPADGEFPAPSSTTSRHHSKPVGDEPVRIGWLAAGSQVRIAARFRGEQRALVGPTIDMPTEHGALVKTRLPLTKQFGLFAGRLVLDTGAAFGDRQVTAILWQDGKSVGNVAIHTIADGQFDVVRRPRKQANLVLEIHTRVPVAVGESEEQRLVGCRVPLQSPAGGERCELGDIVLGELPPLCSGFVVDDRGEPVARASVTVQLKRPERVGRRRSSNTPQSQRRAFDLQRLRGLQGLQNFRLNRSNGSWRNVPLLRTRTDAQGHFELVGARPAGELRLHTDTGQHLATDTPWLGVGQRFHIVLARNGVLRGRALLPKWLPSDCATLTLRPFEKTERQRGTITVALSRRRGGRFVVEPLRAGRYDAIVKLKNLAEPVFTFADVFITAGEARDPRLQNIDLRQSLFRYRLRAVDLGGNPLNLNSALMMRWRKPDGSVQNSGFRWRKGRAEFFAGSPMVEMVSFAPGCEPQELSLVPGDHDVAMRSLVPARLLLPGARQLCGPERLVRVSVILVGDSGYPQSLGGRDQRTGRSFSFTRAQLGKSTGGWLGNTDLVEVPIVKSGKYQVILRMHATKSARSQQVSVTLGEFELKVDGSQLAPITVPIDGQKVLDAIARLRPPRANGGRNRSGRVPR